MLKRIKMFLTIAIPISFLATCVSNTSHEQSRQESTATASAEAEVRATHESYLETLVKEGSDAALEKFYADDFTYVGVDGILIDKPGLKARMKRNKLAHFTLTDDLKRISVYDGVAVLSGHCTSAVSDKGEKETSIDGYTEVWVKRRGKWKLVSEQITPQK